MHTINRLCRLCGLSEEAWLDILQSICCRRCKSLVAYQCIASKRYLYRLKKPGELVVTPCLYAHADASTSNFSVYQYTLYSRI